jgi:Ca-activated chloride channel family protein
VRRAAALSLVAFASLGAAAPAPETGAALPLLERLGWNARERTATGIERLEAEQAESGAAALDTALALRPEDPLAAYNAGSGRLAAGRPDALEPLARAAEAAELGGDRALAADAAYNLGNALYAGGDARGAIDAYRRALRQASDRADAKHNLELALRLLEEQQKQQQQKQGSSAQDEDKTRNEETKDSATEQQDEGSPSGGEGESEAAEDSERSPESPPEGGEQGQQQPEPGGRDASSDPRDQESSSSSPSTPSSSTSSRLPNFKEMPEMNAEQAAALLQAVEDLERKQRRAKALEAARARAEVTKDW